MAFETTLAVKVDPRAATIGLQQVERGLDSVSRKATQSATRIKRTFSRVGGAFGKLRDAVFSFRGALVSLGTGALIRQIVQMADAYTLVAARLSLVTKGTEELITVQQRLFAVAQESRVSFTATGDLYARLARSSKALGVSQAALLKVTETINKAVTVSGASATEASAGLIQFSQGLASGAIRGDELRSVLEQLPRLAQAIAEGMGITVGQLRELGAEGKLQAGEVLAAILSQAGAIEQEFARIPTTVGQAFVVLSNSMSRFIDDVNQSTGATGILARAITGLAGVVDSLKTNFLAVRALFVAVFQSITQTWDSFIERLASGGRLIADIFAGNIRSVEQFKERMAEIPALTIQSFDEVIVNAAGEFRRAIEDTTKALVPLNENLEITINNTGKLSKEQTNLVDKTEFLIQSLKDETEAIKKGSDAWKTYQQVTGKVAGLKRQLEAAGLAKDKINELTGAYQTQLEAQRRAITVTEKQDEITKKLGSTVDRFADGVVDGMHSGEGALESFKNTALSVLRDIEKEFLRAGLRQLFGLSGGGGGALGGAGIGGIISGIGGLFGGLFGGGGGSDFGGGPSMFAAKGAAIGNGRVLPFANGGIVTSPTLFPMANGAGLMGEAGPEAILPLTRGPGGKLGVSGGGGGTTIVIDARGSNGDAAVEEAVERGIRRAAPGLIHASVSKVRDARARDPQFFGSNTTT